MALTLLGKSNFPAKMVYKVEFYQVNTIPVSIIETHFIAEEYTTSGTQNYVIQCLKSVQHYSFYIRQHLGGYQNDSV